LGIQKQGDTANERRQPPADFKRLRQCHQARTGLEEHQPDGIRTRRHRRLGIGDRVQTTDFNTYPLHNLSSLTCLACWRGQSEAILPGAHSATALSATITMAGQSEALGIMDVA